LLETEHHLQSARIGGRYMRYVAEVDGHWVAILTFSGAAPHLKQREKWVGWNARQRARRLGFVINNSRFLLLVERERHPNLALKSLGLALRRVARDWQERWVSMSSKINFQSLEDEGLEFVTRLSNSTLEALLKDLPGETQLELTDAHRLIEIEHNGKRHVIAGGPWRKDRDRERRELRIAKAEAALTKLAAAKRTKPDAHSSRSKPTNSSPTASTKPAFSSGNANTTASKPRPPTTVGISFTPTSPSTGPMPRKSKATTKTFAKSKKPFANSRATSKPERVINHVRLCFLAYWISARLARQWRLCGETGEVTRILRQLQTIRLGAIHLKNEGLQILKQITKVPADLNAQLAKLKLLHLFAGPPAWAKNAEPTQP
jgi:hypothetical protein